MTISFQVTADSSLNEGDVIINTAVIDDGAGGTYERSANATVVAAPDLSASQKQVSSTTVMPDETLSYTIMLANSTSAAAQTQVTDTMPLGTTFVTGSLTSSSGTGSYDPATRTINWNGTVSQGQPVTISFQVTAGTNINEGDVITNTAEISDGVGGSYDRSASTTVVAPPSYDIYLPAVRSN